jgi:hypothetical protein
MSAGLNVLQLAATVSAASAACGLIVGVAGITIKRRMARTAARVATEVADAALRAKLAKAEADADTANAIAASTARIVQRIDASDKATADKMERLGDRIHATDEKLTRVELQFGPNGGGIRQAVNDLATTTAALAGKFEQHVAESRD